MISFRYHVVSIVAVFLALAVGVVVGTTALNGPITDNLRNQVSSLKSDKSSLAAQNATLQTQLSGANQFASSFAGQIVHGALSGKKVAILALPGASATVQSAIATDLAAAGATVTAQIQVTSAFTDPHRAQDVQSLVTSVHPLGFTIPQSTDSGTLGGSLLGYVLLSGKAQQTDLEQVLNGFAGLQMLHVQSASTTPAQMAVVLGGGSLPSADPGGAIQLSLVTALGQAGGQTVVAGDGPSDTNGGVVALVRGSAADRSKLATVDDADTVIGQISTSLALAASAAGTVDAYGTGAGADAVFPQLSAR